MKKLLLIPFLLISSAFAQDLLTELIEVNIEAQEIDWYTSTRKKLTQHFGQPLAGAYDSNTRAIVLNRSLMPIRFKATFYHELCHDLWYHKMTPEERRTYSDLWYWGREAPTKYSKTSMTENFAEMCRISKYDQWFGVTRTAIPRIKNSAQYKFFNE